MYHLRKSLGCCQVITGLTGREESAAAQSGCRSEHTFDDSA
jgi:hypothetical protein